MLSHMLSISFASYQIAMSCGDRENFIPISCPSCVLRQWTWRKKTFGFTVLGGLVKGVESHGL